VDAGGILGFLSGDWLVDRAITDRRSGQHGVFEGRARFRPAGSGHSLEFTEDGELQFGCHRGPARRSLRYAARPDGSADVRFADGRDFYRMDLRSGTCAADHPCRADRYHVRVTLLGPDRFAETWQVTGPDKDYEMRTTYRRTAAAAGDGEAVESATAPKDEAATGPSRRPAAPGRQHVAGRDAAAGRAG